MPAAQAKTGLASRSDLRSRRAVLARHSGRLSVNARVVGFWAAATSSTATLVRGDLRGFAAASDTGLTEAEALSAIEELIAAGLAELVPDREGRDMTWMKILTPHGDWSSNAWNEST